MANGANGKKANGKTNGFFSKIPFLSAEKREARKEKKKYEAEMSQYKTDAEETLAKCPTTRKKVVGYIEEGKPEKAVAYLMQMAEGINEPDINDPDFRKKMRLLNSYIHAAVKLGADPISDAMDKVSENYKLYKGAEEERKKIEEEAKKVKEEERTMVAQAWADDSEVQKEALRFYDDGNVKMLGMMADQKVTNDWDSEMNDDNNEGFEGAVYVLRNVCGVDVDKDPRYAKANDSYVAYMQLSEERAEEFAKQQAELKKEADKAFIAGSFGDSQFTQDVLDVYDAGRMDLVAMHIENRYRNVHGSAVDDDNYSDICNLIALGKIAGLDEKEDETYLAMMDRKVGFDSIVETETKKAKEQFSLKLGMCTDLRLPLERHGEVITYLRELIKQDDDLEEFYKCFTMTLDVVKKEKKQFDKYKKKELAGTLTKKEGAVFDKMKQNKNTAQYMVLILNDAARLAEKHKRYCDNVPHILDVEEQNEYLTEYADALDLEEHGECGTLSPVVGGACLGCAIDKANKAKPKKSK